MGHLVLEVRREVDDSNGLVGTPLDTEPTPDAHVLCDKTDLGSGGHVNAALALLVDGTGSLALLAALLGLALIHVHYGDSSYLPFFHYNNKIISDEPLLLLPLPSKEEEIPVPPLPPLLSH